MEMEEKKKISICTLGCRVNQFESLAIEDCARSEGFEISPWGECADIGIVNTCALTNLAEAKSRSAIRGFAKKNPNSKIALTGCYAQTNPKALLNLPNVAWVLGNEKKIFLPRFIKKFPEGFLENGAEKFALPTKIDEKVLCGNSPIDDRINLKIQDGCDNACSYCIIPRARGLPRSRNFFTILEEAQNLVSRGAREIILTGINMSKFSSPEGGLAELCDAIVKIPELKRLRLGSIEPANFPFEAIAERMADPSHLLAPHLHISAQSLSDAVLNSMRRNYSTADFFESLEKIFTICPDAGIGSDFICGHPGEGLNEFEETKNNILKSGISYAHVFTFSPREKTLAKNMEGADAKIAKERADELRKVSAQISDKFLKKFLGKTCELLLENGSACGKYFGHSGNYAKVYAEGLPKSETKNSHKNRLAKVKAMSIDRGQIFAKFLEFLD